MYSPYYYFVIYLCIRDLNRILSVGLTVGLTGLSA